MSELFDLTPPRVAYPNLSCSTWVVISRLTNKPTRIVPYLNMVNHASEFALPIMTGKLPAKYADITFDVQKLDDVGRPVYLELDEVTETTDDYDVDGNPNAPVMVSTTERNLISLRERADQFNLQEIISAVEQDLLNAHPFYDWAKLILFDDRNDNLSRYQNKQAVTGLASGAPHFFLGPIFGKFDNNTSSDADTVRGHVLLIAPAIMGVEYYFQIRDGVASDPGVGGFKGPIEDIEKASRRREPADPALLPTRLSISRWFPMTNAPVYKYMITDQAGNEVKYFWLRSGQRGESIENPLPIVPFIAILGRSKA